MVTANARETPIRWLDDPFSPDGIRAATSVDDAIREAAPMVWIEAHNAWATGRYDLVKTVLMDWEGFSSATRPFTHPSFPLPNILVTEDPPDHTRTRGLMNRILSPASVRQLKDEFESEAATQVAEVTRRGRFEVVHDLVIPFINKVFGDALGLPPDGREHLIPFGAAALGTFGPPNALFHQHVAEAAEAIPWIETHCERSALAPGGFASQLFTAVDLGEITEFDANLLIRAFLSAGVDTTVGSLANAVDAFARHPEQWALLRANRALIPAAFEEVLRYRAPARVITRVALKDCEIGGVTVRRGEGMLMFFGAAARDPRVWEQPEHFDIQRPGNRRHLIFGTGIHNCVGQMLTRIEGVALLTALVDQVEYLAPAEDSEVLMSNVLQSFAKVPVLARAA